MGLHPALKTTTGLLSSDIYRLLLKKGNKLQHVKLTYKTNTSAETVSLYSLWLVIRAGPTEPKGFCLVLELRLGQG